MALISVYILLIFFAIQKGIMVNTFAGVTGKRRILWGAEFSKVCSNAFNTYCTLPCPFMGPAEPTGSCGAIQLSSRRPCQMAKCPFYDYSDDDETSPDSKPEPDPKPVVKSRQQPPYKDPSGSPPPKTKPKPPPEDSKPPPEDSEPPPKKREKSSSTPASPSIQPSRRFFTSLFSIPGAVVDTLVSGEIVL